MAGAVHQRRQHALDDPARVHLLLLDAGDPLAFTRSISAWSKRGLRSMSAYSATDGSRFCFSADR
jgi:hypothetical protein